MNDCILQNATIPKVTASFTACTVEQKYTLEVEAGFSLGKDIRFRLIKVVLNVEIWSDTGPGKAPPYTTMPGDLGRFDDSDSHFVSLRPGCLKHLGADEVAADNQLPPPYS
ncbi:hypothetical protein N7497_010791 [Penicillium chrysogenum]|nr:hypothetical protein N7497_010791 [Penicillium chrysogenum]